MWTKVEKKLNVVLAEKIFRTQSGNYDHDVEYLMRLSARGGKNIC